RSSPHRSAPKPKSPTTDLREAGATRSYAHKTARRLARVSTSRGADPSDAAHRQRGFNDSPRRRPERSGSEVHMPLDHQPGSFLADAEMRANRTTVTAGRAHDDKGPGH